ncbi:hypothetical protein E3O25_13805 [Cryobacterium sp. TMT1-3]|uniref:hypothetical protein n=1 Tax=Cryobacterium sp. TMT1-3 TaxID=1259237 RepID=UPI00106C7CFE|nr:hypothetical protein [Cryobacterium sp. TMT1-3]TFC25078.1 hypothetical protein E3O25_13805 [Cryobacterium sp. TMT1-3]
MCKICGGITCNEHGQRDPAVPEFVCVLCDIALLNHSAGGGGDGGQPSSSSRFASWEQFLERQPSYPQDWLAEGLYQWTNEPGLLIEYVGPDPAAQKLLAAAAALGSLLEIPPEHLPQRVALMLGFGPQLLL